MPIPAINDTNVTERADASARGRAIVLALIVVAALLQFASSWWLFTPGYFTLDEVWYHWMVRDFSATGGLELWNGYEELASPELTPGNIPAYKGRIVCRYPYLYPAIATPFYRAFGYGGLIILNSLAFVGVVILCFGVARRLFHDDGIAVGACLILVFATYAWEYSQGAWSHIIALLFLVAAFYLMVRAYDAAAGTRSALVWALFSGLVAGLAPGVRIDNVLVFPALFAPFLFSRTLRLRETFALAVGMLPGLALLGWTNLIKFGSFNPIDYGDGTYLSWGPVAVVLVVAIAVWTLSRPFCAEFVRRRKGLLVLIGLIALASAFAVPSFRGLFVRTLTDFWLSVVDVRSIDSLTLAPFEREASGQVVYIGGLKRSLVQSIPYLPLLLLPILRLRQGGRNAAATLILLVTPLCIFAYFSLFTHGYGGLGYNFRYFIPAFPFIAILSAYALKEMMMQWGPPNIALLIIAAAVTAAGFFTSAGIPGTPPTQLKFSLLLAPLIMSGALFCLIIAGEIITTEGARVIQGGAWVATAVAITWAGLVAFFYDFPHHLDLRTKNVIWADAALKAVPDNSIYFAHPIVSPSIVDKRSVRIAYPREDNGRDFQKLLDFHLKAGRRAFATFTVDFWNALKAGKLRDYVFTPVAILPAGVVLGEISLPQGTAGSSQ